MPLFYKEILISFKRNGESTELYSRWKVEKRQGKSAKTGLNNECKKITSLGNLSEIKFLSTNYFKKQIYSPKKSNA